MPTPYAGADVFPASYDIPSGGDTRDAASVNVGLEALGDRTKYLYNRIVAQSGYTLLGMGQFSAAITPSHSWASHGAFSVTENLGLVTITGITTGDLIQVTAGSSFIVSNPGFKIRLRIASSEGATSYTDAFTDVWADPGLSERWFNLFSPGTELENDKAFSLFTMVQIVDDPSTTHIRFALQADTGDASNGVAIPNNAPLSGFYQVFRQVIP